MSLQQAPGAQDEEAEEEPPQDGSHSSHQQQQAAPEEQQAAAQQQEFELQQAAAWGLPPSLARHSAPLPVLLHRLSPGYPSEPPSPGGPLATPRSLRAAQGDNGSSEVATSPFAAANFDPAAVAAAAAAAAVAPAAAEEHEASNQRSITRLMGECGGLSGNAILPALCCPMHAAAMGTQQAMPPVLLGIAGHA